MSAKPTPDAVAERILAILNADDLEIGLSMARDDCRILISGDGDHARLSVRAACRVHEALCATRGAADPDARLLTMMIDVADGSQGAVP